MWRERSSGPIRGDVMLMWRWWGTHLVNVSKSTSGAMGDLRRTDLKICAARRKEQIIGEGNEGRSQCVDKRARRQERGSEGLPTRVIPPPPSAPLTWRRDPSSGSGM